MSEPIALCPSCYRPLTRRLMLHRREPCGATFVPFTAEQMADTTEAIREKFLADVVRSFALPPEMLGDLKCGKVVALPSGVNVRPMTEEERLILCGDPSQPKPQGVMVADEATGEVVGEFPLSSGDGADRPHVVEGGG